MAVSIIFSRPFRVQLDHSVNTHDSDTCLDGTLQLLHLAHAGFQHTGFDRVDDSAFGQVKSVVLVCLLLGDCLFFFVGIAFLNALGDCMANSKLSNKFGRILGCVDGESFGNDEEGLRKFTNGELFPGALFFFYCISCRNN
jgi:hypothetical protein